MYELPHKPKERNLFFLTGSTEWTDGRSSNPGHRHREEATEIISRSAESKVRTFGCTPNGAEKKEKRHDRRCTC